MTYNGVTVDLISQPKNINLGTIITDELELPILVRSSSSDLGIIANTIIDLRSEGQDAYTHGFACKNLLISNKVTKTQQYQYYYINGGYEANGPFSVIFEPGSKITSLASYSFSTNPGSTSIIYFDNFIKGDVILPSSITSIGNYAFSGTRIEGELIIPASVTASSIISAKNSNLEQFNSR